MTSVDSMPPQRRAPAFGPIAARAFLVGSLVATTGCGTCPPFRAAWYLDRPQENTPTIYLALLNEGTQPLALESVLLNPIDPDGKGKEVFPSATVPAQPLQLLPPGRLLLVNLYGKLEKCDLPVTVQIHCGHSRPRREAVSGLLPNYLHEQWINSCQQASGAVSATGQR